MKESRFHTKNSSRTTGWFFWTLNVQNSRRDIITNGNTNLA